jgi:hypothetical protein
LETGESTEGNCPRLKEWESEGLGGAVETKVTLNLNDFKITKTKEQDAVQGSNSVCNRILTMEIGD